MEEANEMIDISDVKNPRVSDYNGLILVEWEIT